MTIGQFETMSIENVVEEIGNENNEWVGRRTSLMVVTTPPFSYSQTFRMKIFVVIVTVLLEAIHAQFVFPPSTEPCPSDNTIIGYTTIAAMNADMQTEIDRIDGGGDFDDDQNYNMILCPGETFDTTAGSLMPLINRVIFTCGEDGDVAGGCVLSGGSENVDIQQPTIDDYPLEMISFEGITFEMFTDRSIDMGGSSATNVEFSDSVWQNFNSDQVFGTSAGTITVLESTITGANGDATANTVFSNQGGVVVTNELTVESIVANEAIYETSNGGSTEIFESVIENSEVQYITTSLDTAETFLSDVLVSNIEQARRLFQVDEDSTLNFLNVEVNGNSGRNMNFQIVRVRGNGMATIQNSTFQDNMDVQHVLHAESNEESPTNPTIIVSDTYFIGTEQNIDGVVVQSQFPGARVEVTNTEFIENTGGRANIGGFFGGYIEFTNTCFFRGNNFIVAFVSEESEYTAFNNYVEDEVSPICGGTDPSESGGRLAVEFPEGRLCFRPEATQDCLVDCTREANDLEFCNATRQLLPSTSFMPSISNAPSISFQPSINDGVDSPPPSESRQPSISNAPSTSNAPSLSFGPSMEGTQPPSQSQQPSVADTTPPSLSMSPSVDGTQSPSVSQAPSVSMEPSTNQPSLSFMPSPSDTPRPSASFVPSISSSPTGVGPTDDPTVQQEVEISASPSTSMFPSISFLPSISLQPSVNEAPTFRLDRNPLFSDVRPDSDDPHDLSDDDDDDDDDDSGDRGKGTGKGFLMKKAKRLKKSKEMGKGKGGKMAKSGKAGSPGKGGYYYKHEHGKGNDLNAKKIKKAKKGGGIGRTKSSSSSSSSSSESSSSSDDGGKGASIWHRPSYSKKGEGNVNYSSSIGYGKKKTSKSSHGKGTGGSIYLGRPAYSSSSGGGGSSGSNDENHYGIGIGWSVTRDASPQQSHEVVATTTTKWHGKRFGDEEDES